MNFSKICILLSSVLMLFFSCTKEFSYELDKTVAHGSLQSDVDGNCLPKNVYGGFIAAQAVNSTNYIELQLNVTTGGSYSIFTDTLNGFYFRGIGNLSPGINTIKLTATGTPRSAGTNVFLISFDSSFCYVPVTVLPAGTGAAVFSLHSLSGVCMDAVVNGTYSPGLTLTADNKVNINVIVSAIGTYSITTATINGMTFKGSGVLTTTGLQVITLTGNGTPVNAETSVITVSAGSSTCTFEVKVEDPSAFDYFPTTVNSNWTYAIDGNTNDTIRKYVIPGTINSGGNAYNIFFETDGSTTDTSGLYRKSGNEYHSLVDIGSLIMDNPAIGDFIFLKDNIASGTSWTSDAVSGTVGGLPVSLRGKFLIVKKDEIVTVNGTAYPNTIAVKNTYEANLGTGGWVDYSPFTGYTITYFSRNIGLIRTEYYNATGTLQHTDDLIKYQVF
ncbi:MAG: hypothetical protein JSS70_07800 [Bacteroidetes bacterium]|nr:hypothetical protein [Bacteroidota bacterium]